jgi:hypothetical protein
MQKIKQKKWCMPCSEEAESGGWRVQSKPGIQNEFQHTLCYKERPYLIKPKPTKHHKNNPHKIKQKKQPAYKNNKRHFCRNQKNVFKICTEMQAVILVKQF